MASNNMESKKDQKQQKDADLKEISNRQKLQNKVLKKMIDQMSNRSIKKKS